MQTIDVSTRTIQNDNFEFRYDADDFVNADSFEHDDDKQRAWIIHNAGYVKAIVFGEYNSYCDQDALDAACDADKLDSLLVTDAELADYETGKDSEGNPEYDGIIYLGNASEPFASESLDYFVVPASLFMLDPTVIDQAGANVAENVLQEVRFAKQDAEITGEDGEDYDVYKAAEKFLEAHIAREWPAAK